MTLQLKQALQIAKPLARTCTTCKGMKSWLWSSLVRASKSFGDWWSCLVLSAGLCRSFGFLHLAWNVKLIYIIEQHQKPPWRDLVFGFMWGTPRESQTFTRESRAKALRKECVKVEPRKQWRKQVDSRSTFHHLRAIFRESNRERYYEIHVAAKARTVRAKEPRKPLRKLVRIRTKSLPGFRRRSII